MTRIPIFYFLWLIQLYCDGHHHDLSMTSLNPKQKSSFLQKLSKSIPQADDCEGDDKNIKIRTSIPTDLIKNSNLWPDQSPTIQYKFGPQGRIEFVQAIVLPKHLNDFGKKCDKSSIELVKKIGAPGDQCGLIISKNLGGSGEVKYNIFPQNPQVSNGPWMSVDGAVKRFFKAAPKNSDPRANLEFWFDYRDSERPSRPTAFVMAYNLMHGKELKEKCIYSVYNPVPV